MSVVDDIIAWLNANRSAMTHEHGKLTMMYANGKLVAVEDTRSERCGKEFEISREQRGGATGLDTLTQVCYNTA